MAKVNYYVEVEVANQSKRQEDEGANKKPRIKDAPKYESRLND